MSARATLRRIDTHHHVVPPAYAAWLRSRGLDALPGVLDRCPDLKVILSHAGGFVPYAAYRIALSASPKGDPVDGMAQLKKFHFDTALSGSPSALPSLLAFAEPGRVLFGSDWPCAPEIAVGAFTGMSEEYGIESEQRVSIDRGAAERLFPRLALSPSTRS